MACDKYRIADKEATYFLTLTVVYWIDLFTRIRYKEIVTDSLAYCSKNKGLEIFARVVMSNHIHLICRSTGETNLSEIIRDFKKFTSKALIQAI
jgi:putative transposase